MKIDKLLIATHNIGKFKEICQAFESQDIKLFSLKDLKIITDCEETGDTFEANAILKAKFYYELSGLPTLGDDSGLMVEALQGEPGVHSRTWPGYRGGDSELLDMLLTKMANVPEGSRTAKFITVAAIFDGQEMIIGHGEVSGQIMQKPMCEIEDHLPYACVFKPDRFDKVFSQLSKEDKNKISHRGQAIKQIISQLKNNQ